MKCLNQDKALAASEGEASQGRFENTYAIIRIGNNGNLEHTKQQLEKLLREFQKQVVNGIEYWFIK